MPVAGGGARCHPGGDADGHIYALAAAGCGGATTCEPLWGAATPSEPTRVTVAKGRVFVTTATGDLIPYAIPA